MILSSVETPLAIVVSGIYKR